MCQSSLAVVTDQGELICTFTDREEAMALGCGLCPAAAPDGSPSPVCPNPNPCAKCRARQ